MVREEIDRSMKDMIYEIVMKQQTPLQNVVEENVAQFGHPQPTQSANILTQPANVSNAKNYITQRQASRAKAQQILEDKFDDNDPFASLIMSAEDPQEEEQMKQEKMLAGPMKKITEVTKGDLTMPENIDFSAAMNKLGIE